MRNTPIFIYWTSGSAGQQSRKKGKQTKCSLQLPRDHFQRAVQGGGAQAKLGHGHELDLGAGHPGSMRWLVLAEQNASKGTSVDSQPLWAAPPGPSCVLHSTLVCVRPPPATEDADGTIPIVPMSQESFECPPAGL